MRYSGTFSVKMTPEPAYDELDGVPLARARFDKEFAGPLRATSVVQMISARTPVPDSAAYVAMERIVGELEGRSGSFVVTHMAAMHAGSRTLDIRIVPNSGTGALAGIAGGMDIEITGGVHHYHLDATLPEPA